MGFRYRKSIRLGKAARINISKSGIGVSTGVKGLRIGTGPRGTRIDVSIPGTGIGYSKTIGPAAKRSRSPHADPGHSRAEGASVGNRQPNFGLRLLVGVLLAILLLVVALLFMGSR